MSPASSHEPHDHDDTHEPHTTASCDTHDTHEGHGSSDSHEGHGACDSHEGHEACDSHEGHGACDSHEGHPHNHGSHEPPRPHSLKQMDADETEDSYRLHRRFDRMGRLIGDEGMKRLFGASVMIVGLGGVGSWAAESLCRSGIGRLHLVDFDRICITNSNRQLQALKGQVGRHKASVLAERLRLINPQAVISPIEKFYTLSTSEELLSSGVDFVVDAIDNITAKCHLIAACVKRGIPLVTSTGASGRMDPTQIKVDDLASTTTDPLAQAIRKILRQKYGFPEKGAFAVPAVFSVEHPLEPQELHYDEGKGFRCVCPGGKNDHHSCEERRLIYGTASFITGAFGLHCASLVVRRLLGRP